MNKIREVELLGLSKDGCEASRHLLIEGLMSQVKYIAKDYVNKGLEWDDLVQEGRIGLIKAIDYIIKKDEFEIRVWTYAKRKVRDRIRDAFYSYANTIRQPKSFIKKQRLLAASNSLAAAIIQETNYDNPSSQFKYGRLDGLYIEQDNWNRLTLHDKLMEIIDFYLTFEEADVVLLKYGFGHEYFDTPDWQKPNKALTMKKIGEITGDTNQRIKVLHDSALLKLQQEEVQFQLIEWRRS